MLQTLRNQIYQGLKRKSTTLCSTWALRYRIMGQPFPGPWSFKHHPWAKDMHDCESEKMVGMKAAQMAYTETALNKTFYNIDMQGNSCLYVLPATTPDAGDFSTSRFDPALELSPHLHNLFSDVKNIGHKRAGSASLFIRGSRSRGQLKSLPVSFVVLDEVDEMPPDNINLAFERVSGQVKGQTFLLSTPTLENKGIDHYYSSSTKEHYFFTCPHCSRLTELIWPDCLIITAEGLTDNSIRDTHLICKECKATLSHESKVEWLQNGQWVPEYSDREVRGFHINQMYSMVRPPRDLAEVYLRGQTDPAAEQEFFNSKLGITHTVEGARVLDTDIDARIGTFIKTQQCAPVPSGLITMGVDVGKWLHYEIVHWTIGALTGPDINLLSSQRLIAEGKVANFEDLDILMRDYNVAFCVIDANPERRKAIEFAQRFYGIVKLCFYGNSVNGKQIIVHPAGEHTITVDRTSWLDLSLGRFRRDGAISLPKDISQEYRSHIKAPVRVYKKDKSGNQTGRYEVANNTDDHFAHAHNYNEIALPLVLSIAQNKDISNIL